MQAFRTSAKRSSGLVQPRSVSSKPTRQTRQVTKDQAHEACIKSRTKSKGLTTYILESNGNTVTPHSLNVGRLSRKHIYLDKIKSSSRWFVLGKGRTIAIQDCTKDGSLLHHFCLVQCVTFVSAKIGHLFACNCNDAVEQRQRLLNLNKTVTENLEDFLSREEEKYCIHSYVCMHLGITDSFNADDSDADSDVDDDDTPVDQLSSAPLLAAVFDGDNYGIVTTDKYNRKRRLVCRSCTASGPTTYCSHVHIYRDWCSKQDLSPEESSENNEEGPACDYTCVSTTPIPYPLPDHLKQVHDELNSGSRTFPTHLVPVSSGTCHHGHKWSAADPVVEKWISHRGVKIYKGTTTISRTPDGSERCVYYRRTVGSSCDCKLHYDGQTDLLFNLNNREMLYYGLLFEYMHFMIEGRNPLAAAHRSYVRTYDALSKTDVIQYQTMRRAWNSFSRLLDVDYGLVFNCAVCGHEPKTIVCDATFLGFRKDLLPTFVKHKAGDSDSPIKGSEHKGRVFITKPRIRELLGKISGISIKKGTKGRRRKTTTPGLTKQEFTELLKSLEREVPSLAVFLKKVCPSKTAESNRVPREHQEFLYELSRNGPVCGMIQVAGDERALSLLHDICDNDVNLYDSRSSEDLTYLQSVAPVTTRWLVNLWQTDSISVEARGVLKAALARVVAPFQDAPQPEPGKSELSEDILSVFPNLSRKRIHRTYAADKKLRDKNNVEESACRKESYGHPSLSPGIFTIFCPHGVCYGFEAMTSYESPRHPFNIFKTRFSIPPQQVIYDNACQLHSFCLNREPDFFKQTRFFVDRFHWKCHVGCSEGYCLDNYSSNMEINAINSQINEQANSGLKRMSGQLSYMSAENFMFHVKLFLAVKNMDKRRKVGHNLCTEMSGLGLS